MGGGSSKKPEITIKAIRASTEDIRSSLRRKKIPIQSKENIYHSLIDNSKKLETLRTNNSKSKQLEIDQIQKLVSEVSEELLEYNDDKNLDKSADESYSFIQVKQNQQKPREKTNRAKLRIGKKVNELNSIKKLNEIEQQLSRIKNDVAIGIKEENTNLLEVQKRKIETLSTDLELVDIPENFEEKKRSLEKDLYRYYQRIVRRERSNLRVAKTNIDVKVEVDKVSENASNLRAINVMMEELDDVLQNIEHDDTKPNLQQHYEELRRIEEKLKGIKDDNHANMTTRSVLLKRLTQTYKHIDDIEGKKEANILNVIKGEINKAQNELQNKTNLNSEFLKNLKMMKERLERTTMKSSENLGTKNELLRNLQKMLDKIDPNHDGVMLRPKKLKSSKSIENLISLQKEWLNLEKSIPMTTKDEVKRVEAVLKDFEESIRIKRKSLAALIDKTQTVRSSDEIIRTSAKIFDLPQVKTTEVKSSEGTEKTLEPPTKKFGSLEYALEEISKVSDRLDEISKEIMEFQGVSEDLQFNFLKASLMDKKLILQNLIHRSSWSQVEIYRTNILEKIDYYDKLLVRKLKQNITEFKIHEDLDVLNTKIKRFTGSYQDVQFENIESVLMQCSKQVETLDSPERKKVLKDRIEFLRVMLKERSHDYAEVEHGENLTDSKKMISENKEYIQKLKKKVEGVEILDINECGLIEESLLTKTMELINTNVKNDTPMFEEVKKMLEDIENCRSLLKKKRNEIQIREVRKSLEQIEGLLMEIQGEISDFDGLKGDQKFVDISKSLDEVDEKLSKIEGVGEVNDKKLEQSLRISLMKSRLEQVAFQSEKLMTMEVKIRGILEIIAAGLPVDNLGELDEELINLKIKLEKLECSEKLSYRKITSLNYIEYLLKKISEKLEGSSAQVSRSVIV